MSAALAFAVSAVAALGGVRLADSHAGTRTFTLNPVADTRVQQARPSRNFGTATRLTTDGGAGFRIESLLRFDLRGVTGTLRSAKLRLRTAGNGTNDGPAVYPTRGGWAERGVTWKTRPRATGPAVADRGAIARATWVQIDVTSLVAGTSVNVLLKQRRTDGVDFYSREGAYKPELVVTTADGSPTPPSPSSSSFPRGIWTDSDVSASDLAAVKGLGFGLAQVNPDRSELDRVRGAGLRAIVWLGNYDDDSCVWNWSDETLVAKVNAVKGHPAIAYYFVADEPHSAASGGCASAPEQIRRRVALVKSLHPGVDTLISENRREDFANLANVADILAVIRYPCSYDSGCAFSKITESLDAAKAAGWRRLWGVPQVFHERDGGYYRAPTASDLRTMLDTWKQGGRIEGLLFYAWGRGCCGDDIGLVDHPELWDTVTAENRSSP